MRRYNNFVFISVFILFSIFVIFFNRIMDPYDIQKYVNAKYFSFYPIRKDFVYKIINAKRNSKFDYIIVGGSTTNNLFRSRLFYNYTKKETLKISYDGISPSEIYEILKLVLDAHPEVETIFIESHIHTYIKAEENTDALRNYKTNPITSFINFYFSIDATEKSIKKILEKFKQNNTTQKISLNNKEYWYIQMPLTRNQENYLETFPDVKFFYGHSYIDKNIKYLEKMKELVDSKNVNAIFYIPPVHSWHLANCYKNGTYKYIEEAKKKFAQITPFYDMAFTSKYTTYDLNGDLGFYYDDILHPQ